MDHRAASLQQLSLNKVTDYHADMLYIYLSCNLSNVDTLWLVTVI